MLSVGAAQRGAGIVALLQTLEAVEPTLDDRVGQPPRPHHCKGRHGETILFQITQRVRNGRQVVHHLENRLEHRFRTRIQTRIQTRQGAKRIRRMGNRMGPSLAGHVATPVALGPGVAKDSLQSGSCSVLGKLPGPPMPFQNKVYDQHREGSQEHRVIVRPPDPCKQVLGVHRHRKEPV